MAYIRPNYKTKKELKQALKDGKPIHVYEPGVGVVPTNGTVFIEGPHGVHMWYAQGKMVDGKLTEVK